MEKLNRFNKDTPNFAEEECFQRWSIEGEAPDGASQSDDSSMLRKQDFRMRVPSVAIVWQLLANDSKPCSLSRGLMLDTVLSVACNDRYASPALQSYDCDRFYVRGSPSGDVTCDAWHA